MDALAPAERARREIGQRTLMLFRETEVAGAFVIEVEPIKDERGFFGRAWCRSELAKRGLSNAIEQINTAVSVQRGTLRGMHYQLAPHAEVKIVQCTRGRVYDVAVDLRPELFNYINEGEELVDLPFTRLREQRLLATYKYPGFWQSMDTFKDKIAFDRMEARGECPWKVWTAK